MDLSDAKRLKQLEDENSKLKRLVADVMLDNENNLAMPFNYIKMIYNPTRKHTNNETLLPIDYKQTTENGRGGLLGN